MIFDEALFFLCEISSTKTFISSLSCLPLTMAVPNETNSVHRHPFNAIQCLADLATQANQHSVVQNSEGKMNDDYRDRSLPLQLATINPTSLRYV